MASASRIGTALRRTVILIVAAAVLGTGMASTFSGQAMAQEHRWSLRDLLFPRRSERAKPLEQFPAPPKPKKRKPRAPAVVEKPAVEKTADARVVLVVGDFLASALADGLKSAFSENPEIAVIDRSNGSSGFVRDDHYDWPGQIGSVVGTEKPAAVIVMMGSNDRQQMKIGETREQPGSDAWVKEYEARTEALGKALSASKVPFLWMGMPAFKSTNMTSDMLAFNDIYRLAAQENGGEFIDIWDGFVDENGAFVMTGPDMNGQAVRLRADDGINVTKAGRRKLAFYAEKPLMKLLHLAAPSGPGAIAPLGAEPGSLPGDGTTPPAAMDRTVPMSLADPALDGGVELMGATPLNEGKNADKGKAPSRLDTPPSGRADDFSGPQQKAEAAAPLKAATAVVP